MRHRRRSYRYPGEMSTLTLVLRGSMLVAGAVLAAWFLTGFIAKLSEPFIALRQEVVVLADDQRRVADKRSEKAALEERVRWLSSTEGAEEESRRSGLTKPGEHSVIFEVVPPEIAGAVPVNSEPSPFNRVTLAAILFGATFFGAIGWQLLRLHRDRRRRPAGVLASRSELKRRRPEG